MGVFVLTEAKINQIHALHKNGVKIREIARRLELYPSTVFRVVHGLNVKSKYYRCPECGALLKTKKCRYCKMRSLFVQLIPPGGNSEIKLELKPEHYKRYLKVRAKKLQQLENNE